MRYDKPRRDFDRPRRDFDDGPRDYDRPRRSFDQPAPLATKVRATVKWFNATKGFGFVTPEDGTQDAFLHASALAFLSHQELPEGATVVVDLVQGQRGPQVSQVHDVDLSTASPSGGGRGGFGGGGGAPRSGGFGRPQRDDGPTEEVEGTVKWFNPDKGFGFIAPDSGGKDIFVHARAVERSGMATLREGDRVRAQVRQGQKGPEAASIELA